MNIQLALRDLDKHASEFNFPVLDNAYVDMAAARLTAFKHANDWAIAVEVLGFSTRQGIFADDVYGFGSCLRKEGFISSTPIMSSSPKRPLFDSQTGAWMADWEEWAIVVKGKGYEFGPSREEYISEGIEVPIESGPGTLPESQLMRFFIHKEGADDLFMGEEELRDELQLYSEMEVFLQTEHWQHPDIVGDEKPSSNISIRSLITALDTDTPALFDRGHPNTNWRLWNFSSEHD